MTPTTMTPIKRFQAIRRLCWWLPLPVLRVLSAVCRIGARDVLECGVPVINNNRSAAQ